MEDSGILWGHPHRLLRLSPPSERTPPHPQVRCGGPLASMVAMVAIPWVWALPMALMTAELSTAMPEAGGYIVWIHR